MGGWDAVTQKHTGKERKSTSVFPITGCSFLSKNELASVKQKRSSKGAGGGAQGNPRQQRWHVKKRTCPFLGQGPPGKTCMINTGVCLQSGFYPFKDS